VRRKGFNPFFTRGSYPKKFSSTASRVLHSPIQHFPSPLFDEIVAYLLKGRSDWIGDDYQMQYLY
jgi:hypothetical protein